MKSYLGNCLLYSLYIWFFTPDSTIHMYYNKKYRVLSFYVIEDGKLKISFRRDRSKKVIIKNILFYVYKKETIL